MKCPFIYLYFLSGNPTIHLVQIALQLYTIFMYTYIVLYLFIYYIPLYYLPTIISTTFTKKLPLFYTASCVLCVFIPKMLFICMNKSLVSEFHISTSTIWKISFFSFYVRRRYIYSFMYMHALEETYKSISLGKCKQ